MVHSILSLNKLYTNILYRAEGIEMDVYGISKPELFRIDDLLDFTNEEVFCSTTATDADHFHQCEPLPESSIDHRSAIVTSSDTSIAPHTVDFTHDLYIPSDDVAELEWLSQFTDDSLADFHLNEFSGTLNFRSDLASFHGRSRSKRSRAAATWISSSSSSSLDLDDPATIAKSKSSTEKSENTSSAASSSSSITLVRKCTHCASEKTPQWRTGPLGPKTLCNACGVRYKSGRLVPEYRPAASPTFVLTQHSNSHRKVMELRRQKEMVMREQQEEEEGRRRKEAYLQQRVGYDYEVR